MQYLYKLAQYLYTKEQKEIEKVRECYETALKYVENDKKEDIISLLDELN